MCVSLSDVGSSCLPQVWKLQTIPFSLNISALWCRHGKQIFPLEMPDLHMLIISGCKSHTPNSCCKPQEHTGLTWEAIWCVLWKSKAYRKHLAYCMCILQPHTDIPAWTMARKNTAAQFLLSFIP